MKDYDDSNPRPGYFCLAAVLNDSTKVVHPRDGDMAKCRYCAFDKVHNCGGDGDGANCRAGNTVAGRELIWFEDTDEGRAEAMALRLEGIVGPL
jgi:hypothetical protein